ncbi:Centrosomal protein of 83 kDa [Triplophysa tibetana]|uniref:Centrosomal protein of 83 kDa n=1 Tax=Triplophysa tibetana TaxID=1572043 RepID=A0A5A9PGQ7_9TELE|nr:Centrosomal protein of 83 kDa [Triplophysa tibetana]
MNPPALGQSTALFPNPEPAAGSGRAAVFLGGSGGLTSSDMELQKMLIDERMRCENHKTNYQTLKEEHTRLQDEYTRAQNELKRLLGDRQVGQEKQQLLLAELRGELLDKTRELEELKLQVLTPQRLELLRAQVQQELEAPIRERFNKLQEEAENYRSEYNKVRYDLTFLKSEFEHQKEEHTRLLEERRIRHEADVVRLERDKEELATQLQSGDPARDGKRVEALLREKAQLHQRLRGLEAEVTELRAERNNSGAQAENVQRIQIRQLAESHSTIKTLEAEKQSIRMQLDRTESELRLSQEQNTLLTGKLHKVEREINSLKSQVEELKHTHKLELSNVKLDCVRTKGEIERERDILHSQVEGLQSDVEVLKATLERNKDLISEKEREMVRRVQAAREEEIHRMAALQEEKLELENHLSELEQKRALQEATGNSQKEEWEERLRAAQLGEESARKELQNLRAKVHQLVQQLEELETLRAENTDLRRQSAELNLQIGTLSHSESELLETNSRLRESLERVREDLRSARTQMERIQQEAERLVEERRVEWLEEKHKLQERDAELREKYSQTKERLQRAAFAQKKRKTMNELKEKKLQDKVQLLKAKIEELEIEASAAQKKSSYSEEHAQLNKRLKELQRRHNEFRRLLLGNQMTSTPLVPSLLIPAESIFTNLQEEQHQRELSVLRRRLEDLEYSQQQQMEELAPPLDRERDSQAHGTPFLTSDLS